MINSQKKLTSASRKAALSDDETLAEVIECLAGNITIETQGACDPKMLFNLLVRAACNRDSVENTAKILQQVPCGNNIRYHLDKLNNFEQLETQLNRAIKSQIPSGLKNGCHAVAIDLNLIPYYGEPSPEERPYIYRSQAKSGTCSFYAYATIYVIKKGKRVTLGVRGVRCLDTKVALLTYLLAELSAQNIQVKKLYLDREFFSIAVIRWLQALGIPFLMPAIRRGKQGGIRQFLKGRCSYKTTYTMTGGKDDSVTFDLWIICKYRKGKRGKSGIEYFAYVVSEVQASLGYLHQDYRKRFGIESSYRLKNLCRIRTTTKKPVLRLLFVGISFLLVNIWVNLLWRRVSHPRRGGRLIYRELFPLKQMLAFLRQAVDRIYKTVEIIYLPSG